VSHGTCTGCLQKKNAVANSANLQLKARHDFYNTIFKVKDTSHVASRSACPMKKFYEFQLVFTTNINVFYISFSLTVRQAKTKLYHFRG